MVIEPLFVLVKLGTASLILGSSGFSVEQYSPQRTRRARRKENFTAKNAKGP
jgi:hypothetical protein